MFRLFYTCILSILFCTNVFGQLKMFSDQVSQKAMQTFEALSKETGYDLKVQFTKLPLPVSTLNLDDPEIVEGTTLESLRLRTKKMNEKDSAKIFFNAQLQEVRDFFEEKMAQLPNPRNTIVINPHTGIYYYLLDKNKNGGDKEEFFQSQFIFGEDIPQDLQNKINAFKPSQEVQYLKNDNITQNDIYLQELMDFFNNLLKDEPITKQKFTFQELNFNNSIQIYDDDGTSFPNPHIKKGRKIDSPICYVRKSRPKVSIKFTYKDPLDKEKVFLKANTNHGILVPSTKANVNEETNEITLSEVQFDTDLLDKVDYVEKFEMAWQISVDGGITWEEVIKTENRLYVVMAVPLKLTLLFETLLFIGCKYAQGKNNEDEVFNGIWQHFETRNVKDKKGKELAYYGDPLTVVTETKDLLDKRVGQCGSFAHLFLDVLYAQGIDSKIGVGNYVFFEIKDHSGDEKYGFLVKNWALGASKSSSDVEYPYQNIPFAAKTTTGAIESFIRNPDKSYNWLGTPEVTDQQGVAGQNNLNPASDFNNHQIIKWKDKFYDPSYGMMYENETQLSERSIEAFYRETRIEKSEQDVDLDLDGDGVKSPMKILYPAYFIKKNPMGLQIKITYYSY